MKLWGAVAEGFCARCPNNHEYVSLAHYLFELEKEILVLNDILFPFRMQSTDLSNLRCSVDPSSLIYKKGDYLLVLFHLYLCGRDTDE